MRHSASASSSNLFWTRLVPAIALMILPWISNFSIQRQLQQTQTSIHELMLAQKELVRELEETSLDIRNNMAQANSLERINENSFQELATTKETDSDFLGNEAYMRIQRVEDTMIERIDTMEKQIQDFSAKSVIQQWGDGPHRVQVHVRDPDTNTTHTFLMELAMLMEQPHSVHHFLKMVDRKVWDGLTLVHGTSSDAIMATPVSLERHEWAGQRFVDANLTTMAFTEYSATYPPPHHHKYSVAFSGRPGGPDFYISMEDDLELHDHESAFALVVEGREVLDRFFLKKENNDKGNSDQMMIIESIRLLGEFGLK
jgi:hypothetical protein